MATFTNQAQLSYGGNVVNSNITTGEIVSTLSMTKTALTRTYRPGERITYVLSVVNSGTAAVNGATLTDDLGTYTFGAGTLVPLTYVTGSARAFLNGVPAADPTVTAGPPLVFSGLSIPAGGNLLLIYEAEANEFAPLGTGAGTVNTATLTAPGITTPGTATETVTPNTAASLAIRKDISPVPVSENGTLTYTFTLLNYGTVATDAADNVTLTDTFNPALANLVATLNGAALAATTDYTYNEGTGFFATVPGRITVPAATYVQNPTTGAYTLTPGSVTLVVSGTV